MKAIGNKIKFPIDFWFWMLLYKELRTVGIQIFMRLQREQQIDNKQKIS